MDPNALIYVLMSIVLPVSNMSGELSKPQLLIEKEPKGSLDQKQLIVLLEN